MAKKLRVWVGMDVDFEDCDEAAEMRGPEKVALIKKSIEENETLDIGVKRIAVVRDDKSKLRFKFEKDGSAVKYEKE